MQKALALFLSLIVILTALSVDIYADPSPISVSAESAVLIDASSNKVIYEKNSDRRMGMASTTKIMTALVAAERCDINKEITVSPLAVGVEGSSIYLYEGERFTLEELLYALLLRSANDAAAAIAIAVGGSIEGFAEMMNEKASRMGLENTNFTNPHGLYDKEHYTTAYDLAVISSHLLKNETLKNIVSTYKITIPFSDNSENTRFLVNHNKMLKMYDGAIGVKTGFTKATGRCLVSAAERDGLTLIAVTLNAPDDWNDHKKMLDSGFDNYECVTIADVGEFSYPIALVGGKEEFVRLTNAEPLKATLPKSRDSIKCKVETYHRFEFAPTYPKTELGKVSFVYNGITVASSTLVCAEFAERAATRKGLLNKLSSFFNG